MANAPAVKTNIWRRDPGSHKLPVVSNPASQNEMQEQELDDLLRARFHLSQFRPGQREVIADLLNGHDVVCVMPTGSGKSLCYQLPAVATGGLTIVVSPLIALMADQVRQLNALGISALLLNSSQDASSRRDVLTRLRRGFEGILYVAPERFAAPPFRDLLPNFKPRFFVIDEAHCVSLWGHDFRPEYMRLAEVRAAMGSPTTVALTATATPQVRGDISSALHLRSPKVHLTGFDRPNLRYMTRYFRTDVEKDPALIAGLKASPATGIVYCATRKTVEELTAYLEQQIPARTICGYHAGMSQAERTHNQELFMREEGAVIVATNAFGMGINKPDIRFVLHYNLPGSVEAFYQEAGRAGRDGRIADCVLYHSPRDVAIQEFFIDKIGENNEQLSPREIAQLRSNARKKLDALRLYASSRYCRRWNILNYFGQQSHIEECRCDVCRGKVKQPPARTSDSVRPRLRKSRKSAAAEEPLDAAAESRYDALRAVRRQIAKRDGIVSFAVMHDRTLREMARRVPKNSAELLLISGIGPRKLEKYGDQLLSALRNLAK